MSTPNTSAVYTAWRTLTRVLQAAQWPNIPENTDGVMVFFGDPDAPPTNMAATWERVAVIPAIDAPDQEWGPIGRGARDERFRLVVHIVTMVPGQTEDQAVARLEELTSCCELAIRDTLIIDPTQRPDEFSIYPMWVWATMSTIPLLTITPDGIAGRAEITVDCLFRINTLPPS